MPQEREIFPSLTVLEDITVGSSPGPWTLERIFDLFPSLAPTIVDKLVGLFETLRGAGLSIVLAEQHARLALRMTDDAIALVRGRVVVRQSSKALLDEPALLEEALTLQESRD